MTDKEYKSYLDEYKTVCGHCLNRKSGCSEAQIIMCYLIHTLPDGVWTKACINDVCHKCVETLSKTIDEKIIKEIENDSRKN